MITMQDIEKAEAQETATRKRVEVLRRQHGIDGGEAVERERRNVDELRTRKARQDQALEERKAALKPHSAELKRLASGLDKSASAVAEAAQEAMEALRRLVAATGAHGAAVQAAAVRTRAGRRAASSRAKRARQSQPRSSASGARFPCASSAKP